MKMRATAKMPRGVLNRYRTRMMTAGEPDVFDEPSGRWSRFYAQHGWAIRVPDESTPAPRRRGRPPRTKPLEPPLEEKTVPELREMAENKGIELPASYMKKDDLIEAIEQAGGGQTKQDSE